MASQHVTLGGNRAKSFIIAHARASLKQQNLKGNLFNSYLKRRKLKGGGAASVFKIKHTTLRNFSNNNKYICILSLES